MVKYSSKISLENIRWKDGALSPVLFFIDDLSNRWVDINGDNKIQPDEDYGYAGFDENGAYHYLEKEILSVSPEIKVTFFVCLGARVAEIKNSKIKSLSFPINYDSKSKDFFKTLAKNPKFELGYHGTTHGIPGHTSNEFRQEWLTYKNIDEGLAKARAGFEIYKECLGYYPKGGKYCGYLSNEFSDEIIDKLGFEWWCRYDNYSAVEGNKKISYCGKDRNPLSAFSIKFFGKNRVVDIPTTVPGYLLNSLFKYDLKKKGIPKILLRPLLIRLKLRQIDYLLEHHLVISLQEHICPSRVDGKRQRPNIFDDKKSLIVIFKYLKRKRVWYCTCSELAEWTKTNIYQ